MGFTKEIRASKKQDVYKITVNYKIDHSGFWEINTLTIIVNLVKVQTAVPQERHNGLVLNLIEPLKVSFSMVIVNILHWMRQIASKTGSSCKIPFIDEFCRFWVGHNSSFEETSNSHSGYDFHRTGLADCLVTHRFNFVDILTFVLWDLCLDDGIASVFFLRQALVPHQVL